MNDKHTENWFAAGLATGAVLALWLARRVDRIDISVEREHSHVVDARALSNRGGDRR